MRQAGRPFLPNKELAILNGRVVRTKRGWFGGGDVGAGSN